MEYLVTGKQMKQYDAYTMERIGIPSLVLMERAAAAAAEEIRKRFGPEKTVCVVAGCGNNGGDALAIGRILQEHGYRVEYLLAGERQKCSEETGRQIRFVEAGGSLVRSAFSEGEPGQADILVDGLFGVGLSREITGDYKRLIERMNETKAYIVAVDIPSGIDADCGAALGCAVKADLTVTYGYRKLGMVFYPGADYCGSVVCRKIGVLWREALERPAAYTYGLSDLAGLPPRKSDGNKGSFGKTLVIAGSRRFYGACRFAAEAAYRMGAGLVRVLTAAANREALLQALPEAMVDVYEDAIDLEGLRRAMEWADCLVIGPGLDQGEAAKRLMREVCMEAACPVVIDADGLNILAGQEDWLNRLSSRAEVYLTPHMGELSRLTKKSIKCCKEERISTVKAYAAAHRAVCVSKDARTVICDPQGRTFVSLTGNNGMATGGSGDLLAGMLAGLLAQGMRGMEAAAMAVYLHGLAGEEAAKRLGVHGMLAGDILNEIPGLLKTYSGRETGC